MPKINSSGPEFSRDREIKVILEDMQSQFRVFGEGLQDVRNKVTSLDSRLTHVERDVSFIKMALPTVATKDDLRQFDQRLTALEKAS